MRGLRWVSALVYGSVALALVGSTAFAAGGLGDLRLSEAPQRSTSSAYMLQMEGPPAIEVVVAAEEDGFSRRQAEGSGARRLERIETNQERIASEADSGGLIEDELFRVATAYNGIAVIADESKLEALAALPGVKAVVPLPEHERNNDYSVPYIGGPAAWATPTPGASSQDLTGAGMKIGIIDTGVDYVHTNFGGPGTSGALAVARLPSNNLEATSTPPNFKVDHEGTTLFPSAKVVGGFDFAGDAYNAGTLAGATPRPDPNPMDCPSVNGGGHGSHVAGSAAGYGVDTAGNTFTGDYSTLDANPIDFRIGPGVAPKAEIYSIRIFGCTGSSNLAVQAIDWALDPDGDGDTSDRLDVINLSLGTSFEVAEDPVLVAAQNAVEAGVIVVGSAGNAGNQTFQLGGAGAAPGAISVANSVAALRTDRLTLVGPLEDQPGTFSASFPWNTLAAPVTGELVRLGATNRYGCSPYSPAETSAVTGKVVMVDWRPDLGQDISCSSAERADNATSAGAIGLVIADLEPTYTTAIAGNAQIPAIFLIRPARQYLIDRLNIGPVGVSFDPALRNSIVSWDQADTVSTSSSRGPRGGGGLKPDLAAPGTTIFSTDAGSGDEGATLTGTSMAAPHVAGAMAVLKQAKQAPGWSVERMKAAAMNTADAGIYAAPGHTGVREAPQRVGAGRVDLEAALDTEVVALAKSDLGEVSANFGPLQVPVGQPFSVEREIDVVNLGATAATYGISFDEIGAPDGVEWSFPDGNSLTVPAAGRASFRLRLSVPNPTLLRHRKEASMPQAQALGNVTYLRSWLSEASGAVVLTASGRPTLRVPAYASLRPAGTLRASRTIRAKDSGQAGTQLPIVGANAGTGGSTTGDYTSVTAGFELQAESPRLPDSSGTLAAADLGQVGVAYYGGQIYFAIGTWGPNPAPGSFATFDVYIDLDRDGTDDHVIYNARYAPEGAASDVFASVRYDLGANTAHYMSLIKPAVGSGAWGAFDSNVIAIPIIPNLIGLSPSNSRFNYRVISSVNGVAGDVDAVPEPDGGTPRYLTWDYMKPGIAFSPVFNQGNVSKLSYQYKQDQFEANGSIGALLFQYLNASGNQAQSLAIEEELPPVVDPGGPYQADEGRPLQLDASGSSDPNGDELTIDWDLDGDGVFEHAGATATVTYDDGPSLHKVRLRVTDGITLPIERDVEIEVLNLPPVVEILMGEDRQIFIQPSDSSGADRAAGFRIEINRDQVYERSVGVSTTLPRVEAPGAWSITATDKDGATSLPVSVALPVVAKKPDIKKQVAKRCRVPRLRGKALPAARRALRNSNCRLGKVRRIKKKTAGRGQKRLRGRYVIRSQSIEPRASRKAGTRVSVRLAFQPKARIKPRNR